MSENLLSAADAKALSKSYDRDGAYLKVILDQVEVAAKKGEESIEVSLLQSVLVKRLQELGYYVNLIEVPMGYKAWGGQERSTFKKHKISW